MKLMESKPSAVLIVTILALAFLAGTFDACMDIRRDDVQTFLSTVYGAWYVGGNEHYTLPVWGPYDFWHFSKSCMMGCWAAIAGFALRLGGNVWDRPWKEFAVAAVIIYWVEGLTFALFYHLVWRL